MRKLFTIISATCLLALSSSDNSLVNRFQAVVNLVSALPSPSKMASVT